MKLIRHTSKTTTTLVELPLEANFNGFRAHEFTFTAQELKTIHARPGILARLLLLCPPAPIEDDLPDDYEVN